MVSILFYEKSNLFFGFHSTLGFLFLQEAFLFQTKKKIRPALFFHLENLSQKHLNMGVDAILRRSISLSKTNYADFSWGKKLIL